MNNFVICLLGHAHKMKERRETFLSGGTQLFSSELIVSDVRQQACACCHEPGKTGVGAADTRGVPHEVLRTCDMLAPSDNYCAPNDNAATGPGEESVCAATNESG